MAGGYLRIGEFSERVGVSPDLLRAWERRYGLLRPDRSQGGFRLYSDEDVMRVERMLAHLGQGLSAAEAARLALESPQAPLAEAPVVGDLSAADAIERLTAALHRFDEDAAHEVLDGLLLSYRLETVLRDVVLPYLARLGEAWAAGEVTVAQEHFASNVVRGRLLSLARGWGVGAGPAALLAAPSGEEHDLALVAFGLVLRRHGWRITFLGADTPAEALEDAMQRVRPRLVVLSAVSEDRLLAIEDVLVALGSETTVAVAGGGATAALAERTGVELLRTDPVTAAQRLAVLA